MTPTQSLLKSIKTSETNYFWFKSKVAGDWNELAIALGLEDKIKLIRKNSHDAEDACTSVLQCWIDGQGSKCDWETLLEAVGKRMQLVTLADELREALQSDKHYNM